MLKFGDIARAPSLLKIAHENWLKRRPPKAADGLFVAHPDGEWKFVACKVFIEIPAATLVVEKDGDQELLAVGGEGPEESTIAKEVVTSAAGLTAVGNKRALEFDSVLMEDPIPKLASPFKDRISKMYNLPGHVPFRFYTIRDTSADAVPYTIWILRLNRVCTAARGAIFFSRNLIRRGTFPALRMLRSPRTPHHAASLLRPAMLCRGPMTTRKDVDAMAIFLFVGFTGGLRASIVYFRGPRLGKTRFVITILMS